MGEKSDSQVIFFLLDEFFERIKTKFFVFKKLPKPREVAYLRLGGPGLNSE